MHSPASLEAQTSRARALAALQMGRYDVALEFATRARTLDPEDPEAHAIEARALFGLERPDEALSATERGLRADPNYEWLHRLRALIMLRLNRAQDALGAANQSIVLAPKQSHGYVVRAWALRVLGRRPEASADLATALALDPQDGDVHMQLGMIDLEIQHPARAERHFRDALAIVPMHAALMNNLGVALYHQGRFIDAARVLAAAVMTNPGLSDSRVNLWRCFVALRLVKRRASVGFLVCVGIVAVTLGTSLHHPILAPILWILLLSMLAIHMVLKFDNWRRRSRLRASEPALRQALERLESAMDLEL